MRKQWIFVAAVSMTIGLSVAWAQQPALPLQAAFTEELAKVRVEIASAEAERQQYSGGLILVVLDIRLQILRVTEAMLDQREKAGRWGVTINYQPEGSWARISPEDSARIENEMAAAQRDLEAAEIEAARWSGGLIQIISQLRVTQAHLALTTLRQQHAMLRLGLVLPTANSGSSNASQPSNLTGRTPTDREAFR